LHAVVVDAVLPGGRVVLFDEGGDGVHWGFGIAKWNSIFMRIGI
jgi:hypothetical protein